jgi:signal peptidase I
MNLESTPIEESTGATPVVHENPPRPRIIAAVASSLLPGAGHYLLRKKRTTIVFFSIFIFAGLLFWPIRIHTWFWGLQIVITASFVLFVVSGWHALRCKSERMNKGSYWWLAVIIPVAVGAAIAHGNLWMLAAGFKPFEIPSTAMEPTLYPSDRVIVDLRIYQKVKPHNGDLVVYKRDGIFYIKRLTASEGNTIEGRDGHIIVDGKPLNEPYTQHLGIVNFPCLNNFGPEKIPPGKLFVLGDNRNVSFDSRMPEHGLVSEVELIGQALYVSRSSKAGREGKNLRSENAQP